MQTRELVNAIMQEAMKKILLSTEDLKALGIRLHELEDLKRNGGLRKEQKEELVEIIRQGYRTSTKIKAHTRILRKASEISDIL